VSQGFANTHSFIVVLGKIIIKMIRDYLARKREKAEEKKISSKPQNSMITEKVNLRSHIH